MHGTHRAHDLRIFATCPASALGKPDSYRRQVEDIARWSEEAGCEGILVYTDNGQVDAWLAAQVIVSATRRLSPLVAVQPAYMHPYSVAKMIASLAFLHGRRVYLNMVAGGFKNDLEALDDRTPHDERYERLAEYTTIIRELLQSANPVSFAGRYYRVHNLRMTPPLPKELLPEIMISGSSDAGMAAARRLGAIPVEYPKPPAEYAAAAPMNGAAHGIRIGIIARPDTREAWSVAHTRFPEDRKGQLTHQLAMKVSDSAWHKQLSGLGESGAEARNPYWLVPFQNYKTFCPYLVGSHGEVADLIARYVGAGYRNFILDVPASPEEMRHIGAVFDLVTQGVDA